MSETEKVRGAGLSREKVLVAALAITDAEGLDALSFRRLASDLGVTPMALYRYVENKDELLDALADLVLSELPEPPTGDWRTQLRAMARAFRTVLVAHPTLVPLFQSRPLLGPAGLRSANAVLRVLRSAGFSPEQSAVVYRQFVRFLLALITLETETGPDVTAERWREQARLARLTFETLSSDEFPHLVEAAPYFAAPDDPERAFEAGLDLFLVGVSIGRRRLQRGTKLSDLFEELR
jgi:TetR/AcrR family transcriptional regulator, tetracycline repressor protein